MSKRLQVLLSDDEYKQFQKQARAAKVSLGEWVRSALRRVNDSRSTKDVEDRLALIRRGYELNGPTSDIDQMNKEIEKGALS